MSITTRLANFDDVAYLNTLIAQSVRGLSTGYYSANQIESALKYVFGIDTQLIADGTYYIAQIGNDIVGCGGWSKRNTLYGGDQHKDIEDSLLNPEYDAARIRAFFVHPNWARRGVGREIIRVCENAALQNGFKTTQLGATLPGEPLYKAMGYHALERKFEVLADGEIFELVIMVKSLNEAI